MDAAALPSQMNAEFISAVTGGRSELVKILLADPRVNPGVGDNCGIRRAACEGYNDILKMLLEHPKVDPGGR